MRPRRELGSNVAVDWKSTPFRVLGVLLIIITLVGLTFSSGCTAMGKDPIIGTWEWSNDKGYTERYTFTSDHEFFAGALGSNFTGTWESIVSNQYNVTYKDMTDQDDNATLTERMIYDRATDAIYFPAHHRVG